MKRLLDFFYQETGTLNQAALLLGLFAFFSQGLAFLRDRLLAHLFGASAELDIYYAAFRIPDFIFVTVASVVSLSVLIPFVIEKEREGHESLRRFLDEIFLFFGLLISGVSVVAYFLMPSISGLLFQGFSEPALTEVVFISRLLLLSPIILGFSNLFGSITQSYNRFAIYALAPLLYNAGIIGGLLFLTSRFGIVGVAYGVVAGALLHALVQVPAVLALGLFPRLTLRLDLSTLAKVVRISLPRTLTLSMTNLAIIFLVSLASLMAVGSISILSLSINLQSVPLSIIGVSYSLAAFPVLSRSFREKNLEAFRNQMATTARFIIFWSLPLSALLIVLRAQIVRVILGSGLFNWEDTRLSAAALALFALSSMFQCLLLLLMRGFYSAGFTRKPFFINLFSTLALVLGALGLVKLFYFSEGFRYFIGALFKVEDLPTTAVLMLPLAFSLSVILNTLLHWLFFEKEFRGFSRGMKRTFFEIFGASVIMGAVAYGGLNIFALFFSTTTLLAIFGQGALAGLLALSAGAGVLALLGNKELSLVWQAAHQKFWKAEVIATDPEIV